MPTKVKKYTKKSERDKVLKELETDGPTIVRIHRRTCPACQMSEEPWKRFCKQGVPGFVILDIEEEALPPEVLNGIQGFPTYAVHDSEGKNKHHTGALMSPEDIEEFVEED